MFRTSRGVRPAAALGVSLATVVLATSAAGARSTHSDGSTALSARLAVLRQAPTPTDALPVQPTIEPALSDKEKGKIIPALSRLVGTAGQTSVYLEVLTPPRVRVPLWLPALGDQVALVAVRDQTATLISGPVPAIDLTNAGMLASIPTRYGDPTRYLAGIMPDNAVRAVWTFANKQRTVRRVVHVSPTNNVALTAVPADATYLLQANWFTAGGTRIPNSTAPFRHAVAHQARAQRVVDLSTDERLEVKADPTLLKRFAVFGFTSPKGTKVGSLTISHPAVKALPSGVLREIARGDVTPQDPEQVREITTASGYSVWIIPGPRGLCVWNQTGGSCATSVTSALGGVGFEAGDGHVGWHVMVYPEGRATARLSLSNGTTKTIRLVDGIYIYRTVGR